MSLGDQDILSDRTQSIQPVSVQHLGGLLIKFFLHARQNIPAFLLQANSLNCLALHQSTVERVTGRKAKGLQMEEIGCKCQAFFFSLSLFKWQEETN